MGREGEGRRGECDEEEGDVGQHRVGAVVAGLGGRGEEEGQLRSASSFFKDPSFSPTFYPSRWRQSSAKKVDPVLSRRLAVCQVTLPKRRNSMLDGRKEDLKQRSKEAEGRSWQNCLNARLMSWLENCWRGQAGTGRTERSGATPAGCCRLQGGGLVHEGLDGPALSPELSESAGPRQYSRQSIRRQGEERVRFDHCCRLMLSNGGRRRRSKWVTFVHPTPTHFSPILP